MDQVWTRFFTWEIAWTWRAHVFESIKGKVTSFERVFKMSDWIHRYFSFKILETRPVKYPGYLPVFHLDILSIPNRQLYMSVILLDLRAWNRDLNPWITARFTGDSWFTGVKLMLVTDFGDKMYWWQVWKITNITKKFANIMILPPTSEIGRPYIVTNITMSPTSLSSSRAMGGHGGPRLTLQLVKILVSPKCLDLFWSK